MILIILGTQDKPFNRLLNAVQKQINKGVIKEEVIVQAGSTKYTSKDMKIFDLIPKDDFVKYIKESSLIITHGGVGSIMDGIRNNKTVIAAPRLKKYGEHVNDHQLEIIKEFKNRGYILELEKFNKLDEVIKDAKKFKTKEVKSNTKNFIKTIEAYIK